ncbi:MAG: phenylalanine--tRNA ligase subunit beta [Clostridiales bacterium]|jgi:phenylalanyl-tRNA synthetase beta chain|nr:phenylalanine--tRNA ligase subunit beta [Clostridiales bacterium]
MKLSLNWIKDYVKLPEDMDMAKLAYDLTMSTVEVESVTDLAREFDGMVIGQITEVLPHPDATKLRICRTDLGSETRDIVCGGINLSPGMKVAVACPGAKVRWHGQGELVEIGNAKVRGVESYGMICASSEIGLFDLFPYTEDATIVDLSEFDADPGTPLAKALSLDDIILEIDNKSMTNRPDLWGHYGIARELSALYSLPLLEFEPFNSSSIPPLTISVLDPQRCPRYIGVRIEGLSVKPSPFELQSRIWRVGMRPINALVDITNYVMLATGQPTHAFDSDNIQGHITVRRANPDEKLLLLNDKELSLSTEDLVIADDECAVGLAGVMGGAKDSVLPTTNKIILEIANFEALAIRKTAARYETRTEAATRYEKALDPERCAQTLSLAMGLFSDLYPDAILTGFSDSYPTPLTRASVTVSLDWLAKRLGKTIPNDEIQDKLQRLGFTVTFANNALNVVAPTWRSTGDIEIKADIMEEVSRMHGFENFEPTPITTSFTSSINQIDLDLERKIKEYLAFRCGMQEVFTYPWMTASYVTAILQDDSSILSLATPPSPDEKQLRSSLIPNLAKAVQVNQRNYSEFSIFETALLLQDKDYSTPYDPRESLPSQRKCLAGAFVSDPQNLISSFRKAKGILESLPRYAHIAPYDFIKTKKPVWADPVVWLNIVQDNNIIGNLALLQKKAAMDCGIKNKQVLFFELDLESLVPFPSRSNKFTHLPEYPMTEYDISLLFDSSVAWKDILSQAFPKEHDELIQSVSFVDEYKGKQVPEGKKSVTLRLVIGSLQKTLTSSAIESAANSVVKRLEKSFGAEFRS